MKNPIFSTMILSLGICALALLASVALWPDIDLAVSGLFYVPGKGFTLADQPVFVFLHDLASRGAWMLGALLMVGTLTVAVRRKPLCGLNTKGWLFLLLGLLIAPGLIANVALKDHWGRARPRETVQFGGGAVFSPALVPQEHPRTNGSFVSGDAAFGFWLPSFGYVMPKPRSRRFFWGGMLAGGLFALARIVMGAHFLSDTLFALLFMLIATAALHALMYGRAATRSCWRDWLFVDEK